MKIHDCLILGMILTLTGCQTTQTRLDQPLIVQVNDEGGTERRFRSPERQRDLWIAPQVLDQDTLLHEQVVTFVEKPQSWQLPRTLEPGFQSEPRLPLEPGEYDDEIVRRQKEIILETREAVQKLTLEMEKVRNEAGIKMTQKNEQIGRVSENLKVTQKQLVEAHQRLADLEAAEKSKREEAARQKSRKWWKLW